MAILILSRFDIAIVNEWFLPCAEEMIVFTRKQNIKEAQKLSFNLVVGFENYDYDAAIELMAIELYKSYRITKVFAFDERDIERASRLRSYFNIEGQKKESGIAFRDKLVTKEILYKHGIYLAPFSQVDTIYDVLCFIDKHDFPVIIKPRKLYSAINVKQICNFEDLFNYTNSVNLENMMIEQYIPYHMVSYNGFVLNNKIVFSSIMLYTRPRMDYKNYLIAITVTDSYEKSIEIKQYGKDVISCLPPIETGPFHCELFINDKDVILCEIASRTAGGGMDYCIENSYGISLNAEWAKSMYTVDYTFPQCKFEKYTASIIIPKKPGIIKRIATSFIAEWVIYYSLSVNVGDVIEESSRNGDRLALAIIEGYSIEVIEKRISIFIDQFENELWIENDLGQS